MIAYKVITGPSLEIKMNAAAREGYVFLAMAKDNGSTIIMEKEVDDA